MHTLIHFYDPILSSNQIFRAFLIYVIYVTCYLDPGSEDLRRCLIPQPACKHGGRDSQSSSALGLKLWSKGRHITIPFPEQTGTQEGTQVCLQDSFVSTAHCSALHSASFLLPPIPLFLKYSQQQWLKTWVTWNRNSQSIQK